MCARRGCRGRDETRRRQLIGYPWQHLAALTVWLTDLEHGAQAARFVDDVLKKAADHLLAQIRLLEEHVDGPVGDGGDEVRRALELEVRLEPRYGEGI